ILARRPTKAEVERCLKTMKESAKDHAELAAEYAKLEAALLAYEKQLPAKQAEWEKQFKNVVAWSNVDVKELKSAGGATLVRQADGSVLATGKNPSPEVYTVTAATKVTGITGVRLEVLPDDSLQAKGPGRAPNGNFVLNEFKVTVAPEGDPKAAKVVT